MGNIILTEQDIINTYSERQRELCSLFYGFKKIKTENPDFGYKKISKLMKEPIHRARNWNHNNSIPQPIQTVNWLKEKQLIPLTNKNKKLNLIAKVLGVTFGDGGIFGNLNGIFLSSSELEAVKEFGEDLKLLFGQNIEKNSRIIEGGEYGHSWCYQNTNRNIIRFFMALGAPIGDKSFTELKVPNWIKIDKRIEDEFYGSLFGNEMGVPKINISKRSVDSLSLGITGSNKFAQNRIKFLSEIADYLNEKTIKTGKTNINDHKKQNRAGESTKIYRLLISTEFENIMNFMNLTKMNYCKYKKLKLASTMNKFAEIKRQRLKGLIERGYDKISAMNLLNLTPVALEVIENYENFHKIYDEEAEQYFILS